MVLQCGGEKGWMRIADVNPAKETVLMDGRGLLLLFLLADLPSALLPAHHIPYSRACGMVIGEVELIPVTVCILTYNWCFNLELFFILFVITCKYIMLRSCVCDYVL